MMISTIAGKEFRFIEASGRLYIPYDDKDAPDIMDALLSIGKEVSIVEDYYFGFPALFIKEA